MAVKHSLTRTHTLILLFPRQYQPLRPQFAGRLEQLCAACRGYIFTLSGERYRGLRIGDFLLYSEAIEPNSLGLVLRRFWLQAILPLKLIPKSTHIDAIISYDPYASGLAGALLKAFLGARLIVEVNGDYHKVDLPSNPLKKWLMRAAFFISIRSADAIKVLNRDQESFFRQRHPSKKLFRFPDFVATRYFQSLQSSQGDYLLSVGFPFSLKGMDVLIRAFILIADRHPRIKLKIMGYCPEEELIAYKRMASGHHRIEFVKPGWIEDVGELMRGCYALVNAARSEALGRIHLEAMACRKPVVATRTNGAMECVTDAETGLLCEIGNPQDLAEKLDYLLSHPAVAASMGRAGFERLQTEFSEERYTQSFRSMLQGLLFPNASDGAVTSHQ